MLKNYRQSPRKVRLVANLIRGKSVPAASIALEFLPKKSSDAMLKLLSSAAANAEQSGANPEELIVKSITVDKGLALKRFKPMARGRAASFRRTMSTIRIELGKAAEKKTRAKKAVA